MLQAKYRCKVTGMDISKIVTGVHVGVSGSMRTFSKKYPVLSSVLAKSDHPLSDWVFFMTTAGVATYLLTHKVDAGNFREFMIHLSRIDEHMPEAIDNFFEFIKLKKAGGRDMEALVGIWVLWNIEGNPPTFEECEELAPAIGIFLSRVVHELSD